MSYFDKKNKKHILTKQKKCGLLVVSIKQKENKKMRLVKFKQSDYYKRKKESLSKYSAKTQKFYADAFDLAETILKQMTFNVEVIPADDSHYVLRTPKINLNGNEIGKTYVLCAKREIEAYIKHEGRGAKSETDRLMIAALAKLVREESNGTHTTVQTGMKETKVVAARRLTYPEMSTFADTWDAKKKAGESTRFFQQVTFDGDRTIIK